VRSCATIQDVTESGVPDAVVATWDRAVESWDDPARHEALIAAVASFSCYAWAAAQYKTRAGDPIADKQLDRLRKAATATMLATATARPEATTMPYRNTMLVLLVLVILIGVGVVYAIVHDRPTTTDVRH
jgi:hypothetical protein